MFFLCIVLLGLCTACIPLVVPLVRRYFPRVELHRASQWLPILAGVLIIVSTQLPTVHVSNQTTTFQQHFVGGVYSACLYFYAKQLFGWRFSNFMDPLVLFAWVSAFGVANKMVEFAFLELHLAHIDTADAYWDLLANTLGGFVSYCFLAGVFYRRKSKQKVQA